MLLHSHVSPGISLDFSLSGTLADMFNKHEDPFPAQSSGCLCGSMPTVQFRLFRGEERENRKNTRTREKAKGTEKAKQTERGYKLCL